MKEAPTPRPEAAVLTEPKGTVPFSGGRFASVPENRDRPRPSQTRGPIPGRRVAPLPETRSSPLPEFSPFESILLFENFSQYKEGDTTDWGQNVSVKLGLDRRKWLVSYVNARMRWAARSGCPTISTWNAAIRHTSRRPLAGLSGFWKDPVASRISLLGDGPSRYDIDWVIGCGSEKLRLNPLEPPPASKYYHAIRLPGAVASEVEVAQPTGTLRITRAKNVINVLLNGQLAAAGMLSPADRWPASRSRW